MVSVLLVQLLGAVLITSFGQAAPDPGSVRGLAAKSQMVLRGTVRLLSSSTVAADDVSDLAVVRLNELVAGPALLKSFVGKDITVRLTATKDAKEGEERVFFADPWVFGDSVGVVEVGSYSQKREAGAQTLARDVEKEKMAAADRELKAKLDKAQLVVAGRVAAVKPGPRRRLTEHDPQWSEAQIEVTEVLKGDAKGMVTMVFPASDDVMWYKTPKPRVGQQNIFILSTGVTGVAADRMAVSEHQDILPVSELSRVKALLGR